MKKDRAKVLILVGSASDVAAMEKCVKVLSEFGVGYELTVASAHRSPERARRLAVEAAGRGIKVIIAAAGLAAHLSGAVAGQTILPVIGVPLGGSPLSGLDALLSTVQMPSGVPVATVAIGDVGAANAGHLALRILALGDPALQKKLKAHQVKMAAEVEAAAQKIKKAES